MNISSQMHTGAQDVGSQLHELPPVPDDRTAAAMFTAHRVNDISNELAHAEERMQVMRGAAGDLRQYHNLHFDNHLRAAMAQADQLKENMLAHYPAEAAEWKALNQVMDLASGYNLNKRSGMISLDLPPGTVPQTPGGVDDHHVTVVYLGPDVDDEAYAEACRRAQEAASAIPGPINGTVGGIGTFKPSGGSDGKTVAWTGAVLPGADQLRSNLADLSASEHKDWKTHITLAYLDPGEPLPAPVPPTPVTFTHLSVHRGKDVMSYPLGGGPVEMSVAVGPAAKAASFAHLLQTIMYDGAHARRHSTAMLADTQDKVWQFDADHAEKHLKGAHEHARKLSEHIADNYPAEAGWLKELIKKEDLSTITGQALDLAHDSWKTQPRDAHGRFTRTGAPSVPEGSFGAASFGRPEPIKPPSASVVKAAKAADTPASMKAVARAAIHSRVYTDVEIGKAMEEIKQLKEDAAKTERAEPRATLAVHLGFIAVGVLISALTAGAAIPLVSGLALSTFPLVASELAEFHVIGRARGMKAIAYPLQMIRKAVKGAPVQMSNTETVLEQTQSVISRALRAGGLDPDLAQQTAAAMVNQWMQTEGWRLGSQSITGQIGTIQFATITGQAIELGKWQDNWRNEMRGAHGEWTRGGGADGGGSRPPPNIRGGSEHYEVPPHERLINPRSPIPDPSDHPFFKAHPMKAANVLHAYSMATDGQKAQGMRWYSDAGLVAGAIAHGDQHMGAGLLSAYSPQTSWPVNMFNAARSVELGRPLGPHEGATVMQSHANAAKKIMDGQSFEQALPAPKTNAFARLIENKGEDKPDDPYGEVVIDRHALSVAAGERLSDKEPTPIGDDRYYQVVADEYRKAALEASRKEGHTVTPSQMQAITWLVQQSANEAEDAAKKQSGSAKGRVTRTANAWKKWIEYAKQNNIDVSSGTTALSMIYEPDDEIGMSVMEHELRDARGRWTKTGGGALAEHVHPEGFSLDPHTGKSPSSGYMVALPGHTHQYPDSVMKDKHQLAAAIDRFLMEEREVLDKPGVHLGGWVSDGKLWLDPSERIADRHEAMKAGKERDQVAIWDVAGGQEIGTEGTGGTATEHAAPSVSEHPPWLRGYARAPAQGRGPAAGGGIAEQAAGIFLSGR